jgi:hypothetical protein
MVKSINSYGLMVVPQYGSLTKVLTMARMGCGKRCFFINTIWG